MISDKDFDHFLRKGYIEQLSPGGNVYGDWKPLPARWTGLFKRLRDINNVYKK